MFLLGKFSYFFGIYVSSGDFGHWTKCPGIFFNTIKQRFSGMPPQPFARTLACKHALGHLTSPDWVGSERHRRVPSCPRNQLTTLCNYPCQGHKYAMTIPWPNSMGGASGCRCDPVANGHPIT
jgi:hypothetical protein